MTKPEPVKRKARQDAGFGCCKCGYPIIEYHHIVENSDIREDIMLLCPIHHHEATVGAMLEEEQRRCQRHPYNIERGFAEGQLKINQKTPVVNVGTNQLIGDGNFLLVDGENLFSIQINEGKLELSLKVYDKEDNLVADIQRNEWISGNPLPWDLESGFQWLRLRRRLRDIELEIDAREFPINIRADMWRNGQNFQLNPKQILFSGVKTHVRLGNLCFVAARIEINTSNQTFTIGPDPRFDRWHIISEPVVSKRVREGLLVWEQLTCEHEFETIINRKKYSLIECSKCKKIEKIWK